LSSVFAARLLGREHFGEFGIIQSSIASFGLFAGFGMGLTTTKYVAEYRSIDLPRAGRIVSLSLRITYATGLFASGIVFFLADQLAVGVLAAPNLAQEIRIASVLIFLGAITSVQSGALSGFEAFRLAARISLVTGIAGFAFTIVGVFLAGLSGAVAALVATGCVSWLINKAALSQQIKKYNIPPCDHLMDEWRTVWRFAIPAVISGISVIPANWASNLILVNQHQGYEEMGLLNATIQWRNIVLFIPSVLITVSLPMLTNLGAAGEVDKQRKVLVANVALAAIIGFGAAALIAIASQYVMASYGPEFEGGQTVLIFQVFAAAIAATIGVMGQFLISSGALWPMIGLQAIWAITYVGLTWLLRSQGAEGVAAAYLAAYIVHFVTMCLLTLFRFRRRLVDARSEDAKIAD
jgi:O-antigen/teichoic acid export membrane protein